MIESLTQTATLNMQQTQRVLTYVKNERMGGFVPKYEIIKQSDTNIAQNIENSVNKNQGLNALAYSPQNQAGHNTRAEQFTFGDLVDMMNPLHHIPVIGHIYRELTGDDIKPTSKIVGGAAFGGPIGVASALIDTIVTQETGKDIGTNALDLAFNTNKEKQSVSVSNNPETAIETALSTINDDPKMTAALLSYSDLSKPDDALLKYEASQRVEVKMQQPTTREPITQVSFHQKGGLYAL